MHVETFSPPLDCITARLEEWDNQTRLILKFWPQGDVDPSFTIAMDPSEAFDLATQILDALSP